jgi:hypothetical protein
LSAYRIHRQETIGWLGLSGDGAPYEAHKKAVGLVEENLRRIMSKAAKDGESAGTADAKLGKKLTPEGVRGNSDPNVIT